MTHCDAMPCDVLWYSCCSIFCAPLFLSAFSQEQVDKLHFRRQIACMMGKGFRKPRLIAFDLDGTLMDSPHSMPQSHRDTVQWLRNQGMLVAVVTGRSILTSASVWRSLGLDTPLVCFNGAFVGVPGQPAVAEMPLDEHEVLRILEVLRPFKGTIALFPQGTKWIVDQVTGRTEYWMKSFGVPITVCPEMHENWTGTTCKVLFDCELNRIPEAKQRLEERFGDTLSIVQSLPDKLEIMKQGINKSWGLARLADYLQVDRADVWAVGDALNDLEMLDWAAVGLAMGHAPQEVKAKASHTLPSIHECGVAAIKSLIENEDS